MALGVLTIACIQANPTGSDQDAAKSLTWIKKYTQMGAVLKFDQNVIVEKYCSHGQKCAYNDTCCNNGCCKQKDGVCCDKTGKCCPQGYQCSDEGSSCVKIQQQSELQGWSSTENAQSTFMKGISINEEQTNDPANDCINCKLLCCDVLGIRFCCP